MNGKLFIGAYLLLAVAVVYVSATLEASEGKKVVFTTPDEVYEACRENWSQRHGEDIKKLPGNEQKFWARKSIWESIKGYIWSKDKVVDIDQDICLNYLQLLHDASASLKELNVIKSPGEISKNIGELAVMTNFICQQKNPELWPVEPIYK